MLYIAPNKPNSILNLKPQYDNYINGKFVAPIKNNYYTNSSPVTGEQIAKFPLSTVEDVNSAVEAADHAFQSWKNTSVAERAAILLKIADKIEANLEKLALAETWDNGKPIRETLAADIPLAADHFRYFAGCIRAQEGKLSVIDNDTTAYHFYEPIGVVAQIIPWNFPQLMAVWKIAPALAAGNCIVMKPARETPLGITLLMEIIGDLLPAGVLNIIHGAGGEIGESLSRHPKIGKVAFTGSTPVGRQILHYAAESIIPSTVELGGKSPNIFFEDVVKSGDEGYLNKAVEGVALAFFNQGEVCTCPSRVLVQESIYEEFIARVLAKVKQLTNGDPLDTNTVIGAQASKSQFDKIMSYFEVARQEGAEILVGGQPGHAGAGTEDGFYIEPTIIKGHNKMRVFQEEIFGPVISLTTFKDEAEAIKIANDTIYGLGSGLWTKDVNRIHRVGRAIQAGRVWVNCYHMYPAHAAFGGYKQSGIGRETHLVVLQAYQQVKNLLVSHTTEPTGLF